MYETVKVMDSSCLNLKFGSLLELHWEGFYCFRQSWAQTCFNASLVYSKRGSDHSALPLQVMEMPQGYPCGTLELVPGLKQVTGVRLIPSLIPWLGGNSLVRV